MSALALAVLLSFVSAVSYAAGAIVQERVATSSPAEAYVPLRRPSWWAAVTLNGLGALLHVVALAYGPLSLVQPLGALTIVFALPMAAAFVGRTHGANSWRGAIMATIGLSGLPSLAGTPKAQFLTSSQRLTLVAATATTVVAMAMAGRRTRQYPVLRSVLLATASGIAFGMASVFTKAVAAGWADGVSVADLLSLTMMGGLALAGMLLSQASYRGAGLAAPLAIMTVVNPALAALVGVLVLGEGFRYGVTGIVLALGCGVVVISGLTVLTFSKFGLPGSDVGRTMSLALRIVGPHRVHLEREWKGHLAGAEECGIVLSERDRRRAARGFVYAAIHVRLRDLVGSLWTPVNWVLSGESRTQAACTTAAGSLAIYIQWYAGLPALLAQGWLWCGCCGTSLYLLARRLRRVRDIPTDSPTDDQPPRE